MYELFYTSVEQSLPLIFVLQCVPVRKCSQDGTTLHATKLLLPLVLLEFGVENVVPFFIRLRSARPLTLVSRDETLTKIPFFYIFWNCHQFRI